MKLPEYILEIANKFKENDYQLYLVGGALRDLLLKREVKDWDFTTDAKPEEIIKMFPQSFYNNQFGTVGIPVPQSVILSDNEGSLANASTSDQLRDSSLTVQNDKRVIEITTMRMEGEYRDSRHPEQLLWTDKIEEDLKRRDFTINAIAFSVIARNEAISNQDNPFIDPFGGQKDLENKLIKAVGDPNKRFQEDALRLLRAIRFATQLEFEIEKKTFQAIIDNSKLIHNISFERVRDEFLKILATNNPLRGVMLLNETKLLEHILPEVTNCFGIVQQGPKHDRVYDIGEHLFLSLKNCPSLDPLVRFACLIHDVGKKNTYKIDASGNVTFYNHEIVGGRLATQIGERFKLSKAQIEKLNNLVRWHMFTVSEHQTDSAVRRFIKNVGLENIDDMMAVRVGDRLGGGTVSATSWRMEKFRERIDEVLQKPFSVTDLKVNGKDVMEVLQIPPSRKVGEILDTLLEEVLEDSEKNNREYLLQKIKELNGS